MSPPRLRFEEVKVALQKHLKTKPSAQLLVVESDADLRKILIEEISDAVNRRVEGISLENSLERRAENKAEVWLMFDKAEISQESLPSNVTCVFLKPIPSRFDDRKERPSEDDLIAVVSGWEKFLTLAKMFLLAARIAPETLVLRSPDQTDWKNGLQNVSMIICDSATAKEFPDDERVRIFRLIADSSLDKLRESIG